MYFLDSEYQITVGSGGLFQGKAAELLAWQDEFARADAFFTCGRQKQLKSAFLPIARPPVADVRRRRQVNQ